MSRGFYRKIVNYSVQKTGLLNFFSLKQRKKLKVLLYHSVSPDKPTIFNPLGTSMHVTDREFRWHLEYLKRHYNFIGADELRQMKEGKEYDYPIILTFDDGYRSVYNYAFPICKELQIPFILFVNGAFIDNKELFWRLMISFILMKNHGDIFLKLCKQRGYCIPPSLKTARDIGRWSHINLDPKDALDIPSQVLREVGIPKKEIFENLNFFLNTEELKELNRHNWIQIADHGFRHLPMIKLSDLELKREIASSNKRLESILKKDIDMFSFSFGVMGRDFDERCIKAVVEHGYRFIFQVSRMTNNISRQENYLLLNRLSVNNGDKPQDIRCMLSL